MNKNDTANPCFHLRNTTMTAREKTEWHEEESQQLKLEAEQHAQWADERHTLAGRSTGGRGFYAGRNWRDPECWAIDIAFWQRELDLLIHEKYLREAARAAEKGKHLLAAEHAENVALRHMLHSACQPFMDALRENQKDDMVHTGDQTRHLQQSDWDALAGQVILQRAQWHDQQIAERVR